MSGATSSNYTFLRALLSPVVWRKAAPIGLSVGILQAIINQGSHWLDGEFTPPVIIRSILTPIVTLTVSLLSAAATHLELQRQRSSQ